MTGIPEWRRRAAQLREVEAQRDALAEALRRIVTATENVDRSSVLYHIGVEARSALASLPVSEGSERAQSSDVSPAWLRDAEWDAESPTASEGSE